jgi:hypothetical protein
VKKSISTEMTSANIARVVELLTRTPQELVRLSQSFAPDRLAEPLRPGDRSFVEIVAHILNCDDRATDSIYAALLLNQPFILDIHPERQWGRLLRYEHFDCPELLAYFAFRRKALLRVLEGLNEAQWSRVIQEQGKQRKESVYWRARGQALHEVEHLAEIETRFGTLQT